MGWRGMEWREMGGRGRVIVAIRQFPSKPKRKMWNAITLPNRLFSALSDQSCTICLLVHTVELQKRRRPSEIMCSAFASTGAEEGPPDQGPGPPNRLLACLRPEDYALLSPHFEWRDRRANDLLYSPGDNVERVYFPCGPSLVAYLVANEDGRDLETALVGREGAVGGIVSFGNLPAYCRIVVKFPGRFIELRLSVLNEAKAKSPTLRYLFARYADCLLAQVFQSTACNAIHSIEQRTAKWILAAMERTGDTRVPLTHEQLAAMLGVGRSYATRVILTFKAEKVLETRRGALVVRNLDALKAKACLCNEAVKSHFDVVLEGVYPATVA